MIKIGRRGSLSCVLEVEGTQGHIAYPHLSKNPITSLIEICKKLKEKPLDKGNKHFQASNLEFTAINVDNQAHNVIPARARTQFNIRYNNFHTSISLKKMITKVIRSICNTHDKLPLLPILIISPSLFGFVGPPTIQKFIFSFFLIK